MLSGYGMDLDAAIHQPRIDASEGAVVIGGGFSGGRKSRCRLLFKKR